MKTFSLRKYLPEIVTFYVLALAALIVSSFFDLKIDIAVNDTSNFVANWFAQTGEMPASVFSFIALAFIAKCADKKWLKTLAALISLGAGGYFGSWFSDRLFEDNEFQTGFGILFGVGTAAVALFVMHFISLPENIRKPLFVLSIVALCALGVQTGLISLMKGLWGRVRFRDLDETYSQFTAWYVINGNTGNHSFPSGHTGSAGMSYAMMFLPFVSEKCRKNKFWCFLIPFAYTTTVALTRLVMGAHYLSDVTVGGIIAFTCVIVGIAVFEKISKKIAER